MDNKYSVYRQIRYNRTYRTLGKMSWWRIILGTVLIILVLLISGFIPQRLAARGEFILAEKLMIAPGWMEQYKPDTKAFIEAGVLYQNEKFEAASEAFGNIGTVDAAKSMKNLSELKIALENLSVGDVNAAYTTLIEIDYSLLSDEDGREYLAICSSLQEHYSLAETKDMMRSQILKEIVDKYSKN